MRPVKEKLDIGTPSPYKNSLEERSPWVLRTVPTIPEWEKQFVWMNYTDGIIHSSACPSVYVLFVTWSNITIENPGQ